MTDLSNQKTRVDQQARNLIYGQPFFGTLLLYLERIEVPADHGQIQTMAVDGKRLYWNPGFVAQLSDAEVQGVLAHEVMHCALRHFDRMESRRPRLWNMATDYVINRDIMAASFKLPAQWEVRGQIAKPCVDHAGEFAGLDSEQVYNRLLQKEMAKPKPPKGAKAGESGEGDGEPGDSEDGAGEAGEGDSGETAGDGEPGDVGTGMGDVIPNPDGQQASHNEAAQWEVRIRQAAKQAAKVAGHVPGSVRELIEALNNPMINWRERMRAFVGEALAQDVSWSRPARRFVSRGLYLPSKPRDAIDSILFMTDTSGSMATAELNQAFSEAQAILDEGGVAKLIWACVDTRVASHGEMLAGDSFAGFSVSGRGGTCFDEPMRWAAEQDVTACIFFSDGATLSWGDEPPFPVLWLGADRDKEILAKAPYGEVATIKL